MKVKFASKDKVIYTAKGSAGITIKIKKNNYIDIEGEGFSITSPGEFEYSHVQFIALEDEGESYEGKVSMVNIIDEDNISSLFMSEVIDLSKEILDRLTNPQVLIIPLAFNKKVEGIIKKLQPSKVILLEGLNNVPTDDKDIKALKGIMNIVDGESTSEIKLISSDIEETEETVIEGYILKS